MPASREFTELMLQGLKRCTVCREIKSHDEFVCNGSNCRDGRVGRCTPCQNAVRRAWSKDNRERKNESREGWRKRNIEHVRTKGVEYAGTRRSRKLNLFVEEI